MRIEGSSVLITGGATGIGRAIAERLVQGGARVAICGRRRAVLAEAAEAMGCVAIPADVCVEDEVVALVARAREELGGLDALINNAAVGSTGSLLEIERVELERVFATNVVGALLVARECARAFVRAGRGTIVNVGSTAAHRGFADHSAYCASKFALTAFTECWRAELRKHGVRVMQVNPSEVQTAFGGRERSELDPTRLVADDVARLVTSMLALDDRGFVTEATLWATNPR